MRRARRAVGGGAPPEFAPGQVWALNGRELTITVKYQGDWPDKGVWVAKFPGNDLNTTRVSPDDVARGRLTFVRARA